MTMSLPAGGISEFVRKQFEQAGGIQVASVDARSYPEETRTTSSTCRTPNSLVPAEIGNALDDELASQSPRAFVVVRKAPTEMLQAVAPAKLNVAFRTNEQLISSASSAPDHGCSLANPGLSYVRDAAVNLSAVTAGRHHLIFGGVVPERQPCWSTQSPAPPRGGRHLGSIFRPSAMSPPVAWCFTCLRNS